MKEHSEALLWGQKEYQCKKWWGMGTLIYLGCWEHKLPLILQQCVWDVITVLLPFLYFRYVNANVEIINLLNVVTTTQQSLGFGSKHVLVIQVLTAFCHVPPALVKLGTNRERWWNARQCQDWVQEYNRCVLYICFELVQGQCGWFSNVCVLKKSFKDFLWKFRSLASNPEVLII